MNNKKLGNLLMTLINFITLVLSLIYYDERTLLINSKSGETTNYIMDFCTLIAFIIAKLFNVSLIGMVIILSLIFIRLLINPITNNYYENRI